MKKLKIVNTLRCAKSPMRSPQRWNGHGAVCPEARCTIANGQAVFKHDGTIGGATRLTSPDFHPKRIDWSIATLNHEEQRKCKLRQGWLADGEPPRAFQSR
jgi:hypothetical protein